MLCVRPFRTGKADFGCGQCMPCRINKRRQWTGRIMLEASQHAHSCFATLTYEDPAPPELVPGDLRQFMRRVWDLYPSPVRFFGVGEYGEVTKRPHYHLALFGMSLVDGDYVQRFWGKGFTHVGELNHDSAQYLAGYVCKKLTKRGDPRLEGRHPEFTRMSLRPGIGAPATASIGRSFTGPQYSQALVKAGDVPSELRVGGKTYPLGRYLREKIREEVGWDKKQPLAVRQAFEAEYLATPPEEKTRKEKKRLRSYDQAIARSKINRQKRSL